MKKFLLSLILLLLIVTLSACGRNRDAAAGDESTSQAATVVTTSAPETSPTEAPPTPTWTPAVESPLEPESPIPTPIAESPLAISVPLYGFEIVAEYPHDPEAFTQGLIWEEDGILLEGTGLRGQSNLRRVELETGDVLQQIDLDDAYFGEGIVAFDGLVYQITWQENTGFIYDQESFELIDQFTYPTEGWGITHDGDKLIMSDGTATLYFWDPETLEEIGQLQVRYQNQPVTQLNELEYIDDAIYANVWRTNHIVIIDPDSGNVTGIVDLSGLLSNEDRTGNEDVLNGIAYDSADGRLFVTGKRWPKLFEIELVLQE